MAPSTISRMLLVASLACLALEVASRKASWDPHSLDSLAACHPSGTLHSSGGHSCSECCLPGHSYPQYQCSPPVTSRTSATLTVNNFEQGGDGGGPSECDNSYHDNSEHVVALSTGWYSGGSRCGRSITIFGNGRSVSAKVVDECDSVNGCDEEHAFEPPCDNNIVDASPSVWQALGVSEDDDNYGYMSITWSLD